MIGVVARAEQIGVVEEFFELFKTPWEFYLPGRQYDVVIATTDVEPDVGARLLLVCTSTAKSIDAGLGITSIGLRQGAVLRDGDSSVPIYGELLTFVDSGDEIACITTDSGIAGLRIDSDVSTVLRLGYDLFEEVRFLLSTGQPIEYAHVPTLEIHIRMLRTWILSAGISLLEIPPTPLNHRFIVCLTHDIDFAGIRRHWLDHSMWGFLYRATVGAVRNFVRRRASFRRLLQSWLAAASLPLVYAGWARDFWEPFEWYLEAERGLPATYFLIPFKRRAGDRAPRPHASRRAAKYDVNDLPNETAALRRAGCEMGVHGIDAWHSVEKGRDEFDRVAAAAGKSSIGIRMHWLLRDARTPSVLENAGYAYDSTVGYNETVGYRAGTTQVFRPQGVRHLLELPLHIQDGALFYPQQLDLSEAEAEQRCHLMMDDARNYGGVLTVLWHDRSHGPERFWGGFYVQLLQELKSLDVWFGTAGQVVEWFRKRREVRFERIDGEGGVQIRPCYAGEKIEPPLNVRIHRPSKPASEAQTGRRRASDFVDVTWVGDASEELDQLLRTVPAL
ncbi:MAG TPA: hypothetical protein VK788_09410 [Terriglobales bacterium]|nr:hypothetical protein [Terriglobales bacterium]